MSAAGCCPARGQQTDPSEHTEPRPTSPEPRPRHDPGPGAARHGSGQPRRHAPLGGVRPGQRAAAVALRARAAGAPRRLRRGPADAAGAAPPRVHAAATRCRCCRAAATPRGSSPRPRARSSTGRRGSRAARSAPRPGVAAGHVLGFDARRHTGELLVNVRVARQVDQVFRRLWEARFPMEQVVIVESIDEEAPPTGDGNGTGGFVCRPITGGSSFSQHAYGLAARRQHLPEPLRLRRPGDPRAGVGLPRPRAGAPGHGDRRRAGGRGVPRDRLGVGRRLDLAEGLPALQCERTLSHR